MFVSLIHKLKNSLPPAINVSPYGESEIVFKNDPNIKAFGSQLQYSFHFKNWGAWYVALACLLIAYIFYVTILSIPLRYPESYSPCTTRCWLTSPCPSRFKVEYETISLLISAISNAWICEEGCVVSIISIMLKSSQLRIWMLFMFD